MLHLLHVHDRTLDILTRDEVNTQHYQSGRNARYILHDAIRVLNHEIQISLQPGSCNNHPMGKHN